MLTILCLWLTKTLYTGFNVFQYLTIRIIFSTFTALVITLLVGSSMINILNQLQIGQPIRTDGPKSHFSKAGTPTMGGTLIIFAIITATLLWSDLYNRYIWILITVTITFSAIGLQDDYKKLVLRNSIGLSAHVKYILQSMIALFIALLLFFTAKTPVETQLIIPFFKNFSVNIHWLFLPITYFVIVGSSNAVNLTDGLDGLAIVPTIIIAGAMVIFCYIAGNRVYAEYTGIPHIPGVCEVCIFCGAIVGAGLGFLWFNTYPAQVFMGDVGALALGAALATVAVIVRQELLLFIMGGIFVIETISVILQVVSFKLTGHRIFLMAPLHHHFELKGWPEPKIIVRFWIITIILVLISLATLTL